MLHKILAAQESCSNYVDPTIVAAFCKTSNHIFFFFQNKASPGFWLLKNYFYLHGINVNVRYDKLRIFCFFLVAHLQTLRSTTKFKPLHLIRFYIHFCFFSLRPLNFG